MNKEVKLALGILIVLLIIVSYQLFVDYVNYGNNARCFNVSCKDGE